MCGRYASTRSSADLAELFDAWDETHGGLGVDYNVAPTDPVPIVRIPVRPRESGAGRVLSVARWGLVPPWAADTSGAARMINARAETVATSRAFARPFAEHRCLVPADGWYEWRRGVGSRGKQPYFMTRGPGEVLAFAGIWSVWGAGSARVLTFSVLTVPAAGDLALIHDRMPLLVEPNRWDSWLFSADPKGQLGPPTEEYSAGIELRPVSTAVGDVRNDGPDLIRAVPTPSPLGSTVEEPSPTLF